MDKKVLNEMFENLLHIGNKSNFWNPKMRKNIYGVTNGIHVINLVETYNHLESVKEKLADFAKNGKKILFVATKLQARDAFSKLATETGNFYVTEKWVPGLLTNFKTIRRRIATYVKLLNDSKSGALDILPKKEKAAKLRELEKLDKAFKGLKEMKKLPDVVFVVDGAFEKQSIKEANSLKIPVFAILNTNGDPDLVDDFIPANTNSVKSLDYLAWVLKEVLAKVKPAKKSNNVKKISEKKVVKKTTTKKSTAKKTTTKKESAKKEEK